MPRIFRHSPLAPAFVSLLEHHIVTIIIGVLCLIEDHNFHNYHRCTLSADGVVPIIVTIIIGILCVPTGWLQVPAKILLAALQTPDTSLPSRGKISTTTREDT